jgi:hypothetical protein
MENLFFTVLGVILGWVPQVYLWVRNRFTSTRAPGITLAVRRPYDRAGHTRARWLSRRGCGRCTEPVSSSEADRRERV